MAHNIAVAFFGILNFTSEVNDQGRHPHYQSGQESPRARLVVRVLDVVSCSLKHSNIHAHHVGGFPVAISEIFIVESVMGTGSS